MSDPTRTPADSAPQKKNILRVAFLTLFLDLLGFGILIPIQPYFAESFGAAPSVITLLSASYSLMQFLFAPLWGALSDRFGRRPIVLLSIACSAAGFLAFGFATSLWMLFLSRMIAGFGNANLGTVQAIVADVTSGKDRAKGMGMIGAAFGLGFIFGPVIGGVTGAAFGPQAPAFFSAGFALINWLYAYKYLAETRVVSFSTVSSTIGSANSQGTTTSPPARGFSALRSFSRIRHLVNVPRLLFVAFVVAVGFSLMETSLSLFLEHRFLPLSSIGTKEGVKAATQLTMWVLLAVGVTAALVQGVLIGPLRKRWGEKTLLIAGGLCMSVSFVACAFIGDIPNGYPWMFPAIVGIAFGSGIFSPSASSLISRSVDEDMQGEALGLSQSVQALGRIAGPVMSGLLFELSAKMPFLVGAVFLAVGAGVCVRIVQPKDAA